MGVVLEIRDTTNTIIGRVDVGDSENFPLSLTRKLSDYRVLNERSGVFSTDFEVPITPSSGDLLSTIYNANLKDTKQFFKEKEAIIYSNEIIVARGKVRVLSTSRKADVQYIKFNFFGNNLEWAKELSELSLSEINFADSSFAFSYKDTTASWSNTADDSDFVFCAIHRGQHHSSSIETWGVNDFRPDLFLKRILTTSFNQVGWNLSSTFFDTSQFKGLIVPYFGTDDEDRWVNSYNTITDTEIETSLALTTLLNVNATEDRWNVNAPNGAESYSCAPPIQDVVLPFAYESGLAGVYNDGTYTYSNWSTFGLYTFDYTVLIEGMTSVTPAGLISGSRTRLMYHNSRTGSFEVASYGGTVPENIIGSYTADIRSGDSVRFYLEYKMNNQYTLDSNTNQDNSCTFDRKDCVYTIKNGSRITCKISETITYGTSIDLADVLSTRCTALDIVNEVTRLFNIYWRTVNASKTVYAEPRDDFFNSISSATNETDRIDLSSDYTLTDLKSELHRYRDFKYLNDSADGVLSVHNRNRVNNNASEYAAIKEHDLGADFNDGVDTLSTSKFAATMIYRGDLTTWQFPYHSKMWVENTLTPPAFSTSFAPRILNYTYGSQTSTLANSLRDDTSLVFLLNDPDKTYSGVDIAIVMAGDEYTTFPYALMSPVYERSTLIGQAPINLSWSDTRDGDLGLANTYYKGSINALKAAKSLNINLRMSTVDFQKIDFRNPIYFSAPEEIQGYWLYESINGFNVNGETRIVNCNLIKVVNSEPIAIGDTLEEGITTVTDEVMEFLSNRFQLQELWEAGLIY